MDQLKQLLILIQEPFGFRYYSFGPGPCNRKTETVKELKPKLIEL